MFILVGEACDNCGQPWVDCKCQDMAVTTCASTSDWMDQVPDGAPRDNGAITIPHRTVNGVGVVGQLRERRNETS